jgi:hypothetical protein
VVEVHDVSGSEPVFLSSLASAFIYFSHSASQPRLRPTVE